MAKKNMTLEEKLEEAIVKDAPYEVPENWIICELGKLCTFHQGLQVPKHEQYSEKTEESERFIRIVDYTQNTEDIRYINKPSNSSNYYVDENDITMVRYGAIGTVGRGIKGIIANNIFKINVSYGVITKEYLYEFLKCPEVHDYLLQSSSSTTMPAINFKVVSNIKICIPPIKEQQRIVDKIESLFEKLDKAKELIEEAREDFEKRKSAILEKAFRGELTKEWRNKNSFVNTILESLLSQNNNIKKSFEFSQATELFNLPDEWYWLKLKDTCEKFKYGTSAKSKAEGKVPVLRMGNLQGGKLDWSNLVYTSDEEEISKYDLRSGDLLFNRTNSPELVGKTSIYEGEREAIYAGYLIRIRTLKGVNSKYINYFMNSIFAKHRCMEVKSDGVSQSNINAEKLGDFDIPLPSQEEQNEIVRILDKILDDESQIEELTQLEEQIELIKKSILAKAFRGKLGTNCEEDESALEILKEMLSKE